MNTKTRADDARGRQPWHQPDPHLTNKTPAAANEEAQRMMDVLPQPPKPFSEQTDSDIEAWLFQIANHPGPDGGIAGLDFAYNPRWWPYGPAARGRLDYIVRDLRRRIDDETRARREREANERAQKGRVDELALRRSKGWA